MFQSATKADAAFEISLHECFRLIGLRGPLHSAWVKPCNVLATMVLAEWMVFYAEKMEGAVLHQHLCDLARFDIGRFGDGGSYCSLSAM